jgi:outer membrane receptor protein involved in Fe transport
LASTRDPPPAVDYVAADQTFQTRITQQVIQANLSGELFQLPAGGLGVAIGAEYRKETSLENNDALTNAGLNAGNALPDTQGEFDVRELYGEINIPILADVPFFDRLSLRAAGRLSDYSTVGTVESYSLGAEWAPIPDIRISGTYARSVRAPNIGELFTGPSQTFPSGINDPCVGVGPTGGGALGTNCRAAPGVLANIAAMACSQSTRQTFRASALQ